MSSKVNKGWLILITIVFILIGGALIYFAFIYPELKRQGIIGGDDNNNQGVISADFTPVDEASFKTDGLTFKATFSNLSVPTDIKNAVINTVIENVNSESSSIEVTLLQAQKCTASSKIQDYEGKYWTEENMLVLSAIKKETEGEFTEDCVVSLNFKIDPFTFSENEDYKIGFQSEDKSTINFSTCSYNKKLYSVDDVFIATDGCNTCTCNEGHIECSDKEACSIESVYKDNENYSRYEGEDKAGECGDDSGCFVGGCSSEVCSAQDGVSTTCDVIDKIPATCTCVRSTCLWVGD